MKSKKFFVLLLLICLLILQFSSVCVSFADKALGEDVPSPIEEQPPRPEPPQPEPPQPQPPGPSGGVTEEDTDTGTQEEKNDQTNEPALPQGGNGTHQDDDSSPSIWLFVGIGGGVLLLAGGGVAAYFIIKRRKNGF